MQGSHKVFISTTTFGDYNPEPLNLLKKSGCEVVVNPLKRKLQDGELFSLAPDAVGLIAGTENLDKAVLQSLPNLKVISRCGIGLENVDLRAALDQGIKVFNTPYSPTTAVAELTIGLILGLLRKINMANQQTHEGQWTKPMGALLSGKKVGLIGFGRIGRKVAKLLMAFDCEICFYDPFCKTDEKPCKPLSLEKILAWADIISIHAATVQEILGEKELGLMKKGSWLINVSRGEALNENALVKALQDKTLSGAALDVFKQEPYRGPLQKMDNVILTPHMGSYAKEARIQMEIEAAKNLLVGLGLAI